MEGHEEMTTYLYDVPWYSEAVSPHPLAFMTFYTNYVVYVRQDDWPDPTTWDGVQGVKVIAHCPSQTVAEYIVKQHNNRLLNR